MTLMERKAPLSIKTTDCYWGVSAHSFSVAECVGSGLPIKHILGGGDSISDDPVGGADAYTHVAIEQAFRAVNDLIE